MLSFTGFVIWAKQRALFHFFISFLQALIKWGITDAQVPSAKRQVPSAEKPKRLASRVMSFPRILLIGSLNGVAGWLHAYPKSSSKEQIGVFIFGTHEMSGFMSRRNFD